MPLKAFIVAAAGLQGAAGGLLGELFGSSANEVALSQPALAKLDCEVSSWGAWGECSERCVSAGGQAGNALVGAHGFQRRNRSIVRRPTVYLGGKECPDEMQQTRECNTRPCTTPAPTLCAASNSPCECTCLAQATVPGQDWTTACAEACNDEKRPGLHLTLDDGSTAVAQTAVAHEAVAAEPVNLDARLALRQHGSDPRKLDVMVSNDKRVGGFRFTLGNAQHDIAPVGQASGGAAASLLYRTAINAKSGGVFGFSTEPDARIPKSSGAVGSLYHVLTSLSLPEGSSYKSWHEFSPKLCVWDAVLSDGDGGQLTVADSCSPLADPLTPAPTPPPTPHPDYLDMTLRLNSVTSEAFDAAPRLALQNAVATGAMVPASAVKLIDARAGSGDGFYYLDVRYALAAPTLQDVNKIETLVVGDEAAFVATVIESLGAAGEASLVTADDVSLRKLQVSGFTGAGSTTAAPAHCASVWEAWSACTVPCGGGGTQLRALAASAVAANAGTNCPLSQTRSCGESSCAPTAAPTPPPTPTPTPASPTPLPTTAPTQWFERVPTPSPTPRVTRLGEVFTTNECSHITCRVLKSKKANGETTHVLRVMHANEEKGGVRHRCMYNDAQGECLCKCKSVDEELCPTYNPGCMTQSHGPTVPATVPAPKAKSAVASP